MKITHIKQQVKNPDRVSIFVDGKYSFSLSLDELLREKLKNGEELDEPKLAKLKKASLDGKLRMRAMEWVLSRPRSVREFSDYLRRKKVDPKFSQKLIDEFLQRGYLDEQNFARWLVELRAQNGKSNRAIIAELFSKGITKEVIDDVLLGDITSEAERIKQVISQKAGLSRYRSDPQKLIKYLASRGFSYDLIKESLDVNPID